MRKPDNPVREVVCSETGKPMPKIPMWMADIRVKFLSDEARQKHSNTAGHADLDAERRALGSGDFEEIEKTVILPGDDEDDADFDSMSDESTEDYD